MIETYFGKILAISLPAFLFFFLSLISFQTKAFYKLGLVLNILAAIMLPFGIVAFMKGVGNLWDLTPYQRLGPIGLPFLMFLAASLWFKDRFQLIQGFTILYGTWFVLTLCEVFFWPYSNGWIGFILLILPLLFRKRHWYGVLHAIAYPLGLLLILIASLIDFRTTANFPIILIIIGLIFLFFGFLWIKSFSREKKHDINAP